MCKFSEHVKARSVPKTGPEAITSHGIPLLKRLAIVTIMAIQPTSGMADACTRISALESYEDTGLAPEGSICETFVGLIYSRGVSCFWEFPFRSTDATSIFNVMWAEVTDCKKIVSSSDDKPVNHPDSYQLKEMIANDGVYRVAIKDKGLENRTLVFLTVEQGD